MALPYFYLQEYDPSLDELILDEDTSKHVIVVLRMKKGEQLNLTDGKGNLLKCEVTEEHKKHCGIKIKSKIENPGSKNLVAIGISLIKNSSRFEWFLEKATEIGVSEIIPLVCERTEKEKFRFERMKGILISAMLQSQQTWLPLLSEPKAFRDVIDQSKHDQKFIAHCAEGEKKNLASLENDIYTSKIILIGPEGDFTPAEVEWASQHFYLPVRMGETRLRTETAGIVAAVMLSFG
jgi:16S rRNA (uracil1498-N3)-methyltransferase